MPETPAETFGVHDAAFARLPGWQQDNHAEALSVFIASCAPMEKRVRDTSTGSGLRMTQALWRSLCTEARKVPAGDKAQARQFFERRFIPRRITHNGQEKGLFTGYYEPVLNGSRTQKGKYRYPLYALPPEMKANLPYATRAQINKGYLNGRKLELVWVDDPVMLFFLHIQGSGRIHLEDGSQVMIGFAGKNGHPYESIGKVAGEKGLIPKDKVDFFTLREWMYRHPDRMFWLMEHNPSYIFFRKLSSAGPVGAAGAVLTPRRSLAVDSAFIPYGLPLYLETELPTTPTQPFNRLMIAQDTGTAIKGPVRGDIFFGGGKEAEFLAGNMKGRGSYSLLVPREIAHQLR